jgi:hypothetical protein
MVLTLTGAGRATVRNFSVGRELVQVVVRDRPARYFDVRLCVVRAFRTPSDDERTRQPKSSPYRRRGAMTVFKWCAGMALAVGAVGFLAGFVGPILLTPDSPQGPLLGIFITGPGGFVLGALVGLCIGLSRRRVDSAT